MRVTDYEKLSADIAKPKVQQMVSKTNPNGHVMSKQFQNLMKYKASSPGFTWPATSHDSLFEEVSSFHFLLHGDHNKSGVAALSCLVGQPGAVIASHSQGRAVMILVVGCFSFMAWDLELAQEETDECALSFKLCREKGAISWHILEDLGDWVAVPIQPCLQHTFGPLCLQKCGDPMPLPLARIQEGLALTKAQCATVLQQLGGVLPSKNQKKEVFYRAVLGMFLAEGPDLEEALAKSVLKKVEEEDNHSGDEAYEELLEHVEAAENIGDQDIKAERQKLKQRKRQKAEKQAVQDLAKRKGKEEEEGEEEGEEKGEGEAEERVEANMWGNRY